MLHTHLNSGEQGANLTADDMDDKDDIFEGGIISYIPYLSYFLRIVCMRFVVDVDNADVVSLG